MIFKQVHDNAGYQSHAINIVKITGLVIYKASKLLYNYINYYSLCLLNRTSQYLLYDSLTPIMLSVVFYKVIIIDFIMALLTIVEGYNQVLVVINKFFK